MAHMPLVRTARSSMHLLILRHSMTKRAMVVMEIAGQKEKEPRKEMSQSYVDRLLLICGAHVGSLCSDATISYMPIGISSSSYARVVDTLGAGDTFNAAMIFSLAKGCTPDVALAFACR